MHQDNMDTLIMNMNCYHSLSLRTFLPLAFAFVAEQEVALANVTYKQQFCSLRTKRHHRALLSVLSMN